MKPWIEACWRIPPKGSAGSVCAMDDVLDTYSREYGDGEAPVCLDGTSKRQTQGDPDAAAGAARAAGRGTVPDTGATAPPACS